MSTRPDLRNLTILDPHIRPLHPRRIEMQQLAAMNEKRGHGLYRIASVAASSSGTRL